MEEIKVNDYVKLDSGKIGQVIAIEKGSIMLDIVENRWVGICCIVKHSSNIIDLIEVGDYVNGSEVVAEKYTNYDMDFINVDSEISFGWGYGVIPENDIKSIVTKEQFANAEYKVKE